MREFSSGRHVSRKRFVWLKGLLALMVTAASVCASSPAQAWYLSSTVSGTYQSKINGVWTDQPLPTAYSSDFRSPSEDSRVSLGGGGIAGGGTEIRFNLTITTTANPSPREPPPYPTVAAFKVDSQVSAYGTVGQVDNGFDNPKVVSSSGSVSQSGLNLVQAPVSGGIATFTRTVSGSSNGYGVGLSYRVTGDNRSVRITSPTFFDAQGKNWRKEDAPSAPGATPRRFENERSADGGMSVDSTATYLQEGIGSVGAGSWYGGGTYNPQMTGFGPAYETGRRYEWRLSNGTPTGEAPATLQGIRSTLQGAQYGWPSVNIGPYHAAQVSTNGNYVTGIALGGTEATKPDTGNTTLIFKVTDSLAVDGAVAQNKFSVFWHTPRENWVADANSAKPDEPATGVVLTDINEAKSELDPSDTFYVKDVESIHDVDLGGALGKASLSVSAIQSGVTVAYLVSVGTTPPGWFGASLTLLATALRVGSTIVGSPPHVLPKAVTGMSDYASYRAAVQAGDGAFWPGTTERRFEYGAGTLSWQNFKDALVTNDAGTGDKYWIGQGDTAQGYALKKKAKRFYIKKWTHWVGDEYKSWGYNGPAASDVSTNIVDLSKGDQGNTVTWKMNFTQPLPR